MHSLWCFPILSWILRSIPLSFLTIHHCISTLQATGLNKARSFPLPKGIMLLTLASTRDLFPADLCWPWMTRSFLTLCPGLNSWHLPAGTKVAAALPGMTVSACSLASLCSLYIWCSICYSYFQICGPYRFPTLSDAFCGILVNYSE